MFRFFLHYGLHFLLPILIGFLFYKKDSWKAILILLSGILIDLDHLLANPVFDSCRCSIGYHPLHGIWAIVIYFGLFAYRPTRIYGLALLIHIFADSVDCALM